VEVVLYKLNTKRHLDSLKSSDLSANYKEYSLSATNRKLILNFVNYCFSEGIGEHRALKYLSTLKIIAKSITVDFDKALKQIFVLMLVVLKGHLSVTGLNTTTKSH